MEGSTENRALSKGAIVVEIYNSSVGVQVESSADIYWRRRVGVCGNGDNDIAMLGGPGDGAGVGGDAIGIYSVALVGWLSINPE